MIGHVYIGNEKIGDVDFHVLSYGHCVISGEMMPDDNYKKYRPAIQEHFKQKGISNIHDFNYRVLLPDKEVKPQGGIGIIDFTEDPEITAEVYGLDRSVFNRVAWADTHKRKHEVWEDISGHTALVMPGVPEFGIHKIMEPGSKLIHTLYASSHYDAMTIYYRFMQWGPYTTQFESDKRVYE